jgi:hypothetical protein
VLLSRRLGIALLLVGFAGLACRDRDETVLLPPTRDDVAGSRTPSDMPMTAENLDGDSVTPAAPGSFEPPGPEQGSSPVAHEVSESGFPDAGSDAGGADDAAAPVVVSPPDLCAVLGEDGLSLLIVATDLFAADLETACQLSGLTSPLDSLQQLAWFDYLVEYGNALFGCAPLFGPPPGGIEVFGLANTAVTEVPPPPYGADDAEALITLYLATLADVIALSPSDEQVLHDYLSFVARNSITPGVSGGLSTCESPEPGN